MTGTVAATSPAGFWKRYVAYGIDVLLLWIVLELLVRVFFPSFGQADLAHLQQALASGDPEADLAQRMALVHHALALLTRLTVTAGLAYTVLAAAYFGVFESSSWQATPGKRLLGIRVTDVDGARIGTGRALIRFFAASLSWLTMNLGHALAAMAPDHRALHDYLAATRVVNADPARTSMPWWGWLFIVGNVLAVVGGVVAMVWATVSAMQEAGAL